VLASGAVGFFSRLEAFFERFFQAPAGKLGAALQPEALAHRIERAMETTKSFGAHGALVPNRYQLHLHPADFAVFASYRTSLQDDLEHGVLARARRHQYILVAKPLVELLADESVPRGEVRVAASLVDQAGGRVHPDAPPAATSDTLVLARPGYEVPAPDSAARAYFLVRTAGAPPVVFDLGAAVIGIGRASDNDVIVDDEEVSRHHCQLKLQHGAYSLTDLGSRNGTTINGEPISQAALGPGDVVRIGSTEIEFRIRG